jgi:hypothetical protein
MGALGKVRVGSKLVGSKYLGIRRRVWSPNSEEAIRDPLHFVVAGDTCQPCSSIEQRPSWWALPHLPPLEPIKVAGWLQAFLDEADKHQVRYHKADRSKSG